MQPRKRLTLMLAVTMLSTPALASETVTYRYDAKGRLVEAAHSGSVNNGVSATYQFGKADNRVNVQVTGAAFNGPAQPVAVVPLNGFQGIFLGEL